MARRFAPIGRGLNQDLSSDPADKDILQYNSTSKKWEYVSAPIFGSTVNISNAAPKLLWTEDDAAADNQRWDAVVSAEQWRLRVRSDDDLTGADILTVDRTGIVVDQAKISATTVVVDGALRILDATEADYMNMAHSGSNMITTFANTSLWDVDLGGTNGMTFGTGGAAKFWLNFLNSRVEVHDGWPFRVYNSADTDYIEISHDGTDATIHCHQTTQLNFTGPTSGINFGPMTVTTDNSAATEVGYKGAPINAKTANYTLVLSDVGKTIRTSGAGITITIPPNSSVAFPTGTIIWFMNIDGSNNVTIAEGTGVGIIGQGTSVAGSMTLTPRTLIGMIKYTTDGWCYIGTP
jgi:hypothetical protein